MRSLGPGRHNSLQYILPVSDSPLKSAHETAPGGHPMREPSKNATAAPNPFQAFALRKHLTSVGQRGDRSDKILNVREGWHVWQPVSVTGTTLSSEKTCSVYEIFGQF